MKVNNLKSKPVIKTLRGMLRKKVQSQTFVVENFCSDRSLCGLDAQAAIAKGSLAAKNQSFLYTFSPKNRLRNQYKNLSAEELMKLRENLFKEYQNTPLCKLKSEVLKEEILKKQRFSLSPVYKTAVMPKDSNCPVFVYLEHAKSKHGTYCIKANIKNKTKGKAHVLIPSVGAPDGIREVPDYYYDKDNKVRAFFIQFFATSPDYKGVGKEIVKKVVKDSKAYGYEGRVYLYASPGQLPDELAAICGSKAEFTPIPAYWKMGFRTANEKQNKIIRQAMEKYEQTGVYNGPKKSVMYLPKESIEKYL